MSKFFKIVFIVGFIANILFLLYSDYDNSSLAVLCILIFNFIVAYLFALLSLKIPYIYNLGFVLVIGLYGYLWDQSFIIKENPIELIESISNFIYGLLYISAFTFFIPAILYLLFTYSIFVFFSDLKSKKISIK